MATDIIARGMITEYKSGTNISFKENEDGSVTISASGGVSSEDTVARDTIDNHKLDKNNPHNVTPTQIGLGNVDNTSDLDKPISTAVQTALNDKANTKHTHKKSDITDFPNSLPANGGNADTVNGHTVEADVPADAVFTDTTYDTATKTEDGLMSAADKSKLDGIEEGANKTVVDTALSSTSTNPVQNKVISAALNSKASSSHFHDSRYYTETEIDAKLDEKAGKDAATQSADGLMSAEDKVKLDGIATGANAYSLPTATSSVLGGVKTGSNITNSSGTISLTKENVTAALGYTPPTTNTTYGVATQSANGLMSAADKKKLDGLSSGGSSSCVSGAYIGDGSKTRSISLGFRPCAVIISTLDGSLYYKNTGVLVVDGYIGCTHNSAGAVQTVEIIDSGFKFLSASVNTNGEVYFYVAFK